MTFEVVPVSMDWLTMGWTSIIPTVSALDADRQVIYFVALNTTGSYLVAHLCGMDLSGVRLSRADTKVVWVLPLPGILTSIQVLASLLALQCSILNTLCIL